MKQTLQFLVFLLVGFVLFLPKENIYYSVEKALSQAHLYLGNEKIHNRLFYLDIQDASLLLDSMPIGTIEHITIAPVLFYNRVSMSALNFNKEFASLFPKGIESLSFTYTLFSPLKIIIEGNADFGPLHGAIDLEKKQVEITIEASQKMRDYPLLLAKLHKSEKGLVYETSF